MIDPQHPTNPENRAIPPLPDPAARPAPEPGPLTKPAPVIRPPKRKRRWWVLIIVVLALVTAGVTIAAVNGAFG